MDCIEQIWQHLHFVNDHEFVVIQMSQLLNEEFWFAL